MSEHNPIKSEQNLEEALFEAAIRKDSAEEREAFLTSACGEDEDLRSRLEVMVEGYFEGEGFLTQTPDREPASATGGEYPTSDGPGTRIGAYKLLQAIGQGGFGSVYMAEQKEPVRRRVALKIIKLGMDTRQVVARFEAERQALALMDHPNIARVFDGGSTETGRPYFVMELVKGTDVINYCDEKKLSTNQRLELFISICHAIQHAHQKGVIHRDLKPSNVLVATQDGEANPKVIDFGIAKATQFDLTDKTVFTQFEQFMGTPAYMSPEQVAMDSSDIDTRSDIYSLGVLLYELLTGKTPLEARELTSGGYDEMRRRIREVDPPRPSNRLGNLTVDELTTVASSRGVEPGKLGSTVRGDLDWIVLKAMDKDRNRRYASASEFADDIQRYLRSEPVTAVKPSLAYLFGKFTRRHRAALSVAACFLLLLIAGATVSTGQAIKAKEEEKKAVLAFDEADEARLAAMTAQQREEELRRIAERSAYAANLTLAQRDWQNQNYDRVRRSLARTEGYERRGYEWQYWKRMTNLYSSSFSTYAGGVRTFSVNRDGTRGAFVMNNNTIEIRSLPDGEVITTYSGHPTFISTAKFTPDGSRVISCGGGFFGGTIRIWDPETGAELVARGNELETPHRDDVGSRPRALAISPDGKFFVTGGEGNVLNLWETETGRKVARLAEDAARDDWNWVERAAFTTDGRHVVFSAKKIMGICNVETGQLTDSRLLADEGVVGTQFWNVVAIPGTSRIAIQQGGNIAVYDTAGGAFSAPLLEVPVGGSIAVSPAGDRLVAHHSEDAIVIDLNTGEELLTLRGGCDDAQFLGHSTRIVATDGDREVTFWDARKAREWEVREIDYLPEAFSPDGSRLLVRLDEEDSSALGVIDTETGKLVCEMRHPTRVMRGVFSPDGKWVATHARERMHDTSNGSLKIWSAETGVVKTTISALLVNQFGPEGKTVIGQRANEAGAEGPRWAGLGIWDVETGELLFAPESTGYGMFTQSADGRRVAGADGRANIRVWDRESGEVVAEWKAHPDREFGSMVGQSSETMAFTSDGKFLFTAGITGVAKMWEADTGELVRSFEGHQGAMTGLQLSRDEQRLITYSMDQTLRLWDVETGDELLVLTDPVHERAWVWTVAESADGTRLYATQRRHRGSEDNRFIVWEASSRAQADEWMRANQADEVKWASVEPAVTSRTTERRDEAEAALKAMEETEDEEILTDPRTITNWLFLGAVPIESGGWKTALDAQQIPEEGQLRPRGNQVLTVRDAELTWKAVKQSEAFLEPNSVLGEEKRNSVAYAVCYLHSDESRKKVKLNLGHLSSSQWMYEGGAKIYFNGEEVYPAGARGVSPVVDLEAGNNAIVLKLVVGDEESWPVRMGVADADTRRKVPGVRFSLDPGE